MHSSGYTLSGNVGISLLVGFGPNQNVFFPKFQRKLSRIIFSFFSRKFQNVNFMKFSQKIFLSQLGRGQNPLVKCSLLATCKCLRFYVAYNFLQQNCNLWLFSFFTRSLPIVYLGSPAFCSQTLLEYAEWKAGSGSGSCEINLILICKKSKFRIPHPI